MVSLIFLRTYYENYAIQKQKPKVIIKITYVAVVFLVAKSYPTLCDPLNSSLPSSSVHGISQARIMEWVALSFSRVPSRARDLNLGLLHCGQILYHLSHQGSL